MLSLSSLTHYRAIACCRITHPTAAIVLAMGTRLIGGIGASQNIRASQQSQVQGLWHMPGVGQWTPLQGVIGLIKHQPSIQVLSRSLSMGFVNHMPSAFTFIQKGAITLDTTCAIGDLADGLNIRDTFEYLVNLGFKSESGENSDPRQPTSGRYRFNPIPA